MSSMSKAAMFLYSKEHNRQSVLLIREVALKDGIFLLDNMMLASWKLFSMKTMMPTVLSRTLKCLQNGICVCPLPVGL